jgi:protein TonB
MTFALDDDTTRRYRHMPALGALISASLHAGVALALVPAVFPQQPRLTELAIPVTLDLPLPPNQVSSASAAVQAARNVPPGTEQPVEEAIGPALADPDAAAAPTRVPREPDVALLLPSAEPPPPVAAKEIGAGASPPAPAPNLESALPPVNAPPLVSGRDFASTAPPAVASSPAIQPRPQAPAAQQPVRQATPRRASQQQQANGPDRAAGQTPSAHNRTETDDRNRQVQQDYLMLVVRKLSRARFQDQSREENTQGLVVTRLTVAADGRLLDLSVVRSSGFPGRDRSVAEAIRGASPFPPVPPEIGVGPYTFVVPIGYALER